MTRVVFFGASSVEGTGASSPGTRYSTLVSHALGWEDINLGLGGSCVTGRDDGGQIVDDDSGIARVPDVIEKSPDIVFIHYGANDFGTGKPLGDPQKFQQGTFLWDFDTLLRGLREGLPSARIILCTAQYRADAEIHNAQGLILEDYNRAIIQLGERYGLRVLDPYHGAGIDGGNFSEVSADASHLNDAGYAKLAAFLVEDLRQAYPLPPP